MKINLKTLVVNSLLIVPTLYYSQMASNMGMTSGFTSHFSKQTTSIFTPISYSDIMFNKSDLIKPNMLPSKLVGGVNSEHPEIGAIVSPDGKTLYFSRYQHPGNTGGKEDDEDIWYSEWDQDNNKWSEAKNMGAPLNNKHPNYINSISPDGNTILLGNRYLANGKMGPGFSISTKTETGWSFPKEINIAGINKDSKWAGCHFSNDQKVLVMAYEQRKNTYGDRDIYVSFIKADNSWSTPINLGGVVNTKGTESSPFLADDDSTLYYTSDGLPGYGGNDIYVTRRLDNTWQNWSEPENLGPNINTGNHQSFFSVSNGKVYFSSECEKSSLDIFTLGLPEAPPTLNPTTEQILVSENKEQSTNNNPSVASLNSDMALRVVFYDLNKSDLKKTTIYELDQITKILNASPSVEIEIAGHTDNVGSGKYNYQLSQKRIDAILLYFKNQSNIDEKRIVVKNYGETMPFADNKTEKGRKLNRRVEITLKTKLLVNN